MIRAYILNLFGEPYAFATLLEGMSIGGPLVRP